MTWLLWLYPRGWRQRYGDEVALHLASERRSLRLFLDLLAGAVDARLNPQWTAVHSQTEVQTEPHTESSDAMNPIQRLCSNSNFDSGFSPTEQRRSAAWMLGACAGFTLLGLGLDFYLGKTILSQAVLYAAFPMALIFSSRSTYLKAYPQPVRSILLFGGIAGMFLFMLGVTYIADRI